MEERAEERKGAFKQFIYFFKQTFRRHTGGEYSEFLTRGIRKDDGANRQYPWVYVRLFALLFVLFAVFLLVLRFTGNQLFAPTVMLLASLTFSLPFLFLLYELYPRRDLSLIVVVCAMIIAGTLADIITQVLYSLFPAPNAWLASVYTAFFEELPKTFAAILAVIAIKNKQPLAGFLIGAAVGCGFSVVEDFGYLFINSGSLPAINLTNIIETVMIRGFSALCTHMLWTGAVAWAYCYFSRRFFNVGFYFILLLSCGLHICWDLPLGLPYIALIYAGCAAAALAECSLIIYFDRKKSLLSYGYERSEDGYYTEDTQSLDKTMPEYWAHGGKLALVICCVLMAMASVIYCAIPFRETYYTRRFTDAKSFVEYMHDGYGLQVNSFREFDGEKAHEKYVKDGIWHFVQYEEEEEVTYIYTYKAYHDDFSDNDYYFMSNISARITRREGEFVYPCEEIYNGGKLYATFFHVNADVTGYNFDSFGNITVFIYDADFVRDLSQPQYAMLFITFGSLAGAALVTYFGLKIKAWRVKRNVER